MLETSITFLKPSLEIAAVLIATAALRYKKTDVSLDKNPSIFRLLLNPALIITSLISILSALNVYLINMGFVEPEMASGVLNLIAAIGALLLIVFIWLKESGKLIRKIFIPIIVTTMILPRTTDIILRLIKLQNMTGISTESFSKIAGLSFAIFITTLFGILLSKGSKNINRLALSISASALVSVLIIQQVVIVVQFGFTYGFIPLVPFLLSIFAPLINSYDRFFYALLATSSLYPLLYIFTYKKQLPEDSANPAEHRKFKATLRRERRIFASVILILILNVSLIAGQSIAKNIEKKASELSPAKDIKAIGSVVKVSVKDVNDGKLHRFAYTTKDNVRIRFIIIHKGAGIYGVGFDFCDICGPAGYFQKGSDVICKNCDVAINIPTIGFPGGCNPVPLNHKVKGKWISITVKDIEKVKEKFR